MRILLPIVSIIFFLLNFGNVLLGQDITPKDLEEINQNYYGNYDYWKASHWYFQDSTNSQRLHFQSAVKKFEKAKNWEAFIKANTELVKTYQGTPNFIDGIKLGETTLKKIKKQAPSYRKKCGNLVYQTGLAFPYPYHHKKALQKFSYAKNIEKNLPIVDSLFLGKIYGTMGISSMQLNDIKNAKIYFTQSKSILSNHSYKKSCTYGWYPTSSINPMICDTIIDDNGNIGLSCVSGNPPYRLTNEEKCDEYLTALRNTYSNLAAISLIEKKHEEAIQYLEKGVEKMEFTYDGLEFVNLYLNFGKYYFETFEFERSNYFFKKTIQIINKSETENEYFKFQIVPECYYFIGTNYINIEKQQAKYTQNYSPQFDKATIYLERAFLPIETRPNFEELKIKIFTSAANFFLMRENFENPASEILNYADSLFLNDQPIFQVENFEEKTKVNYNYSKAELLVQNNQPRKAIALLKENIKFVPWTTLDIENAKTNFKIAKIYHQIGLRDSALIHNHQAIIAACKNFKTPVFSKLPRIEDINSIPFFQDVLLQKATLLAEFSKLQTNQKLKKKWLNHAIEVINLADKYHEKQLREIKFLKSIKVKSLIQNAVDFYLKGIFISYELYQLDGYAKTLEKGFYYTQKMKGQELTMATLKSKAERLLKKNKNFLDQVKKINEYITEDERQVFNQEQEKDTLLFDEVWYQTERLYYYQKELEKITIEIEEENPAYFKTKYAFVPKNYSSIQEAMEEDELIIEYVNEEKDIYIFTITKNSPLQIIKVAYQDSTTNSIQELKNLLSNSPMNRRTKRKQFVQLSHQLYQQYLLPIEDQFKEKKRLIIIGDDQANYIPFEVLLKSKKIKRFKKLDYLVKNFKISYHYSATLFAEAKRKTLQSNVGIYAFAPVYDAEIRDTSILNNLSLDLLNSKLRAIGRNGFLTPLPMSELEVVEIIKLFNNKNQLGNILDLRKDATEISLKKNLSKPYQFIHIAGHSFANSRFPNYSGIACYENLRSLKEDDILYTNEIYDLKTKADLITLSSCESGYGKNSRGEGLLGLNRAFIYSGTPNVIYSLWKVYDKTNAILMVNLYKNIIAGENYVSSLRKAKLDLLKREATASPHFWAPYLLIGR